MKQLGTVYARQLGLHDWKGEGMEEFPADLKVRAFPGSPVEGWQDNFKRSIVTNYDFLTGLHTIQIESIEALDCYGREIRKALRSQLFCP